MRVAQHRGDLGARRPRRDLGYRHRAVGAAEPFHVGEPGAQPQRLQGGRRDLPDAGVLGPADVAGQPHHPLHPRVPQHLERRGQVVRDRVPDDLPFDHHAVVRALLPGEELLEQRGLAGIWRGHLQPGFQVTGIVEAERALRPSPGGRLDHQREADLFGEGLPRRSRRWPAGAVRTARRRRAAPSSSAPCRGSCARSPRPYLRCPAAPVPARAAPAAFPVRPAAAARAHVSPSARTAQVICPPSSASSIRQCAARLRPQLRGQAVLGLAGDQGQLVVRQPRRCLDESRRRVEQIGRDEGGGGHEMNVPRWGSCRCAAGD